MGGTLFGTGSGYHYSPSEALERKLLGHHYLHLLEDWKMAVMVRVAYLRLSCRLSRLLACKAMCF